MRSAVLMTMMLFAAPLASAQGIAGLWKHAEEPGWIEIQAEEGAGTVVRNDKFPARVGRQVLKDIEADADKSNRWTAQIFAERLGEYREAEITLPKPDEMHIKVKVGFMSRTVEWRRVESLPDA